MKIINKKGNISPYKEKCSNRGLVITLLDPRNWAQEALYEVIHEFGGKDLAAVTFVDTYTSPEGEIRQNFRLAFFDSGEEGNRSHVNRAMVSIESAIEYLLPAKIYSYGHKYSNGTAGVLRTYLNKAYRKLAPNKFVKAKELAKSTEAIKTKEVRQIA